jgi:hypothetical protein
MEDQNYPILKYGDQIRKMWKWIKNAIFFNYVKVISFTKSGLKLFDVIYVRF